jgi:hypothetical protein
MMILTCFGKPAHFGVNVLLGKPPLLWVGNSQCSLCHVLAAHHDRPLELGPLQRIRFAVVAGVKSPCQFRITSCLGQQMCLDEIVLDVGDVRRDPGLCLSGDAFEILECPGLMLPPLGFGRCAL